MEQIYGMKNYIHEFSYLNEATKEHIIYKNIQVPIFTNIT